MNCRPFIDVPLQTLKQGGKTFQRIKKKGEDISKIIFFKVMITLITKPDKELRKRKITSRFYLVTVDAIIK